MKQTISYSFIYYGTNFPHRVHITMSPASAMQERSLLAFILLGLNLPPSHSLSITMRLSGSNISINDSMSSRCNVQNVISLSWPFLLERAVLESLTHKSAFFIQSQKSCAWL